MSTPRRAALRAFGVVACAAVTLAILRPWTVQPIQTAQPRTFDAVAYVDDAWPRTVQEAEGTAVTVVAARAAAVAPAAAGAPTSLRPVFVKVTGVVTDVDRRSRVGVAQVQGDAGERVAVQVGPVLRGTALRDALGFVRFTDFANQTEFAAIANAFNDRVLRDVVAPIDLDALKGRTLTIVGAAVVPAAGNDAAIDVVPVVMRVEGGTK